jgi:transposase
MKRFVEGVDRLQGTLFPDALEDWVGEDNPVRVIDVFVDELDLCGLGFDRVDPLATGRPGYHPAVLDLNKLTQIRAISVLLMHVCRRHKVPASHSRPPIFMINVFCWLSIKFAQFT